MPQGRPTPRSWLPNRSFRDEFPANLIFCEVSLDMRDWCYLAICSVIGRRTSEENSAGEWPLTELLSHATRSPRKTRGGIYRAIIHNPATLSFSVPTVRKPATKKGPFGYVAASDFCWKMRRNGRFLATMPLFEGRTWICPTNRRLTIRRATLRPRFPPLAAIGRCPQKPLPEHILASASNCRVQSFTDCYHANFIAKNFFCGDQNSINSFATRGNNLISI